MSKPAAKITLEIKSWFLSPGCLWDIDFGGWVFFPLMALEGPLRLEDGIASVADFHFDAAIPMAFQVILPGERAGTMNTCKHFL